MNKFLIKLLCFIGLHKWKYEGSEYEYNETYTAAFEACSIEAFRIKEPVRECSCCGKKQKMDIHCLGLKPPKYVIEWVNC